MLWNVVKYTFSKEKHSDKVQTLEQCADWTNKQSKKKNHYCLLISKRLSS